MEVKVERFALNWGFMFEIVTEQDHFELWLYNKHIGFKEMVLICDSVDEAMSYAFDEGFLEHILMYHERFMR